MKSDTDRAMRRTGVTTNSNPAGALLRYWRNARHMSQLALAHEAGVSPRHVCFLETGRARPSRDMIHVLAETLDVPLRARNALLLAAGFAPTYREGEPDLGSEELAPVRAALEAILRQQEPYPAVVMDRIWNLVDANDAARRFFGFLLGENGEEDEEEPVNVLRMMFDPRRLRPYVANWEATANALLLRVHREAVGGVLDSGLQGLHDELLELLDADTSSGSAADSSGDRGGDRGNGGNGNDWRGRDTARAEAALLPVIPVVFTKGDRTFRFFSTVSTLGTPQDVLLQELRIECFFPLDATTRTLSRKLASEASEDVS